MATIGLGQVRSDGSPELPLITCGDDVMNLLKFLRNPTDLTYSARDVVNYLLSLVVAREPAVTS